MVELDIFIRRNFATVTKLTCSEKHWPSQQTILPDSHLCASQSQLFSYLIEWKIHFISGQHRFLDIATSYI
ncbi:hypothetical protein T10_3804 [Trichinella papuae]|uniref:Uncharacterized protein n=1 Tax=Trichinella papuae TaxID=268474 RepID=A0A0V1MLX2_9BILA|nr:hypothetical protein T10_3804 [Trichinella papuae]